MSVYLQRHLSVADQYFSKPDLRSLAQESLEGVGSKKGGFPGSTVGPMNANLYDERAQDTLFYDKLKV